MPWLDTSGFVPDPDETLDPTTVHIGPVALASEIREISALGATLRGWLDVPLGAAMYLELGNGQRVEAVIAWRGEQDVGVRFTRPIDVMALITRQLVAQPADRRQMPRVEVLASAWLRKAENFLPVTIRNISAGGLQIEGEELPAVNEGCQVFLEGLGIPPGEVIWRREKRAGIHFERELGWQAILPWVKGLHASHKR
ncbi:MULTISPECIES: PilZ domain-containing protein [Sphingomonas]|uniref:PilZ domain-containing protein n=1 Tax=Sphingomonas TaxID=13687 RepID=UPI000DEEA987|nr:MULTISPECIES: PilZ domain-containing protein [Sphingomonas]